VEVEEREAGRAENRAREEGGKMGGEREIARGCGVGKLVRERGSRGRGGGRVKKEEGVEKGEGAEG